MDPVSLAIKGRIKCCEHHNLLNIGQNFGTSPQAVWQVRNCIESMSQAPKLFLRSVTDHVWGDLPLNTKHSVVSFSLLGISSTLHWCTVLCVYLHCKVSIGQYTKMCTSPLIFSSSKYFRWQIFEENIWSLSLSLYIWPLESWTIIAIIRFNSILRMIWGRVEC